MFQDDEFGVLGLSVYRFGLYVYVCVYVSTCMQVHTCILTSVTH